MKDTVKEYLDRKKRRASRRKKAAATLLSLSLVVAGGVTWSLHQTGESLTGETFCGKTEHTHTEACLKKDTEKTDAKEEKVLTCTLPEHTHTDACITKTLICGMKEGQGAHTHTADCYQEQQMLTCTQTEHVHGGGCYDADGNLICEIPEHTHGEGCYTTEQVLVCGQEESAGHVHTDACYEITYSCGMEEHTHTDACYSTVEVTAAAASPEVTKAPEYVCGLEEHKHTLACYSNPNADVETAAVWEQTIAGVKLTGDYGKDVVAIAKTQLGYHESTANYNVVKADDGTEKMKGYTRYGAWYGSPYEDWCAMFASFCISYAHVDYPLQAYCPDWIDTLSYKGMYAARDSWTPAVGDLVFFDQNGDGTSDHVGIVEALTKDGSELGEEADLTAADGIKTIEGNTSDQVAERSYSRSDSTIMGYGVLPVKAPEYAEGTQTAQCDEYTVTVTYGKDAKLSKDAKLKVEKAEMITADELSQDIAKAGDTSDQTDVTPLFKLKIGFIQDGKEVEPAEGSKVSVKVSVSGGLTMEEGTAVGVLHYKSSDGEDTSAEIMANVSLDTAEDQSSVVSFDTDHFSEYVFYMKKAASSETTEAEQEEATETTNASEEETTEVTTETEAASEEETTETTAEETTDASAEETTQAASEETTGTSEEETTETSEEETTEAQDENDSTNTYAARVEELLEADDSNFVILWEEYEREDDAALFEEYINDLEITDPDTYDTIVSRVDELINSQTMAASLVDGAPTDSDTISTVNYYVFINGQRVLWKTENNVTGYKFSGDNHHFISGDTLANAYSAFGVTANKLSDGNRYFAHVDGGGTTIWGGSADVHSYTADGTTTYYSMIINGTGTVDIYYLPNHTLASNDSWSNYTTSESFYTVTVSDNQHRVYGGDGQDAVPDTTYTVKGSTATVTVKNADGVTWTCAGADGTTVTGTDNDDGTTTYTISNISQAYTLTPRLKGEHMITYNLNLPQTPLDTEYGTPKIGGSSTTYTDSTTEASYTVLAPTPSSYVYVTSGKYRGNATFQGWAITSGGDVVYEAGKEITDISSDLTLYAVWKTGGASTSSIDGPYVNFFVALTAVSEGTTNWEGSTSVNFFTESVYATNCGVNGSDVRDQNLQTRIVTPTGSTQYFVKGDNTGDLETLHKDVVDSLTAGFDKTGTDGNTYHFQCTIPTDEEVLRNVRTMVQNGSKITINGHTLTADELTAENFTVKWNVFKWDDGDGWHIDGLLIAKKGKMKVTKTFAGDETTIKSIKDGGYTVNVDGATGCVHNDNTDMNLNAKSESNANGYDSYDAGSDTYTWYVDVDQFYNYTVSENNYTSSNTEVTTNAGYNVSNAKTASQNTTGWQSYSTGVTVTGQTYDESTGSGLLTVSYLNTYVKAGTLIVQKIDSTTRNLMKNIKFKVEKQGDSSFQLYQQTNNGADYVGHYTDKSDPDLADLNLNAVTDNIIQTDSNGQAYLAVANGTYTLTEQVVGYKDPGVITVSLTNGEDGSQKIVMINSASSENKNDEGKSYATFAEGTLTLNVENTSPTTSVTMVKNWADGENSQVTLQLYRNGESMGSDYLVTLDGKTDDKETTPWQVTFDNLPLYVDGGQAEYTIRETNIGGSTGFNYSIEYTDGYKYYDVTVSGMVYKNASGNVVTDPTQAANGGSCTVTCTNQRTTAEVWFNKVSSKGGNVSGAEFYLYKLNDATTKPDGSTVSIDQDVNGDDNTTDETTQSLNTTDAPAPYTYLTSKTSGTDGKVSFGDKLADGYYYLIEHKAPRGYELSQTLYLIHKDGGDVTIEYWDEQYGEDGSLTSSGWKSITSANQITNEPKTMAANITIIKKAAGTNGAALSGAEFTLKNSSGKYYTVNSETKKVSWSDTSSTLTSGTDGEINFTGLPAGTYTLTETKAPDGYHKLAEAITITVSNDGKVTAFNKGNTPITAVENSQTSRSDGWDQSYEIENSTGAELPHTGGTGTTLFTLSGLLLVAVSLVYGCGLRRRRERRIR